MIWAGAEYQLLASAILRDHPGCRIVTDSRQVRPGDIFVAVTGTEADGCRFAASAAANGAAAVICPENAAVEGCGKVELIRVPDSRRIVSYLYKEFYGSPDESLDIYTVTGTNGKTTSAYLIKAALESAGVGCGLFSTVEFDDGINRFQASHTTPDAGQFFKLLAAMKENGLKAAAMESSSHALAQCRLDAARISGAIFTNLTGDHLDYHLTTENYFAAKLRLFTELLAPAGRAAVNIDDPYGRIIAGKCGKTGRTASFGTAPEADYRITGLSTGLAGIAFTLNCRGHRIVFRSSLTGKYNIYNLAGAAALLGEQGFDLEMLAEYWNRPFSVPGRLERVECGSKGTFFVDFAHTDDALRNVLTAAREFTGGKLWVIFGAGGDRDKSKRPRMGKAAGELADKIIITSDNPRSEDPEAIIAAIRSGVPDNCDCRIEPDRRKALEFAWHHAGEGDVVIVAGKGHENYQEINGVKYPFSDRQVLKEAGL